MFIFKQRENRMIVFHENNSYNGQRYRIQRIESNENLFHYQMTKVVCELIWASLKNTEFFLKFWKNTMFFKIFEKY